MKTPNGKFLFDTPIRIEGPLKYKEKTYPVPSNFYLDIIYDSHYVRFGYENIKQAKEDFEFLISKSILVS